MNAQRTKSCCLPLCLAIIAAHLCGDIREEMGVTNCRIDRKLTKLTTVLTAAGLKLFFVNVGQHKQSQFIGKDAFSLTPELLRCDLFCAAVLAKDHKCNIKHYYLLDSVST